MYRFNKINDLIYTLWAVENWFENYLLQNERESSAALIFCCLKFATVKHWIPNINKRRVQTILFSEQILAQPANNLLYYVSFRSTYFVVLTAISAQKANGVDHRAVSQLI